MIERLRRDGVVITDFATVFGETALFDEAAAEVRRRYEARPSQDTAAGEGSKGTFLTKLGDPSYDMGHVFARIALHPRALAVANGYLKLRSTLRAAALTTPARSSKVLKESVLQIWKARKVALRDAKRSSSSARSTSRRTTATPGNCARN